MEASNSQLFGINVQELLVSFVILLSVPISIWFRLCSVGVKFQMIVNLLVGLIGLSILLPFTDLVCFFMSCIVAYNLAFLQRYGIWKWTVTFVSMLILSLFHIRRMYASSMTWSFDITGPLMIATVKFSTYSFDIDLFPCCSYIGGLLPFFSFVFSSFTIVVGPAITFKEYIELVSMDERTRGPVEFPRVFRAIGIFALTAFACVFQGWHRNLQPMYFVSEEFSSLGFAHKIVLLYVIMGLSRCKYYAAWNLCEVPLLLLGLKSEKCSNADPKLVEFSPSISRALGKWNVSVAHWLKHYVYKKALAANSKDRENSDSFPNGRRKSFSSSSRRVFAMAITRIISAVWHGFYPGYYISFAFLLLGDKAETVARHHLNHFFFASPAMCDTKPIFARLHYVYTFVGWLLSILSLNYYVASFFLYNVENTFTFWKNMYFSGHILHLGVILLLPWIIPRRANFVIKKVN